jgi:hypothetical protein
MLAFAAHEVTDSSLPRAISAPARRVVMLQLISIPFGADVLSVLSCLLMRAVEVGHSCVQTLVSRPAHADGGASISAGLGAARHQAKSGKLRMKRVIRTQW